MRYPRDDSFSTIYLLNAFTTLSALPSIQIVNEVQGARLGSSSSFVMPFDLLLCRLRVSFVSIYF